MIKSVWRDLLWGMSLGLWVGGDCIILRIMGYCCVWGLVVVGGVFDGCLLLVYGWFCDWLVWCLGGMCGGVFCFCGVCGGLCDLS